MIGRIRFVCAVAFLMPFGASAASGASCSVSSVPVVFGDYDPFSPTALENTGQVSIQCDSEAVLRVGISEGNGSFDRRLMWNGSDQLEYNLYGDAARTVVWGDGISAADVGASGQRIDLPIFGQMPSKQNVPPGVYQDVLTITVSF